jgi:osmoprotectant transport system substrate-binding protein
MRGSVFGTRRERVLRKHTRRAVKAAFAVALGVALILGFTVSSGQSAPPTISLGTKNFTEVFILGQLYKQALQAKGYKVSYHENIGSTEITDTALTSGKINMYSEYTGIIVSVVGHVNAPQKSAQATYNRAKKIEEKRGFTLFAKTPFYDVDAMGVPTSTAKKYGLRTVADLKKVPSLSVCGFPEFQTRYSGLVGLRKAYGITKVKFVPLAGISVYAAMDAGKCKVGDVFTTDPQLLPGPAAPGTAGQHGKYTVLRDTKNIFGFQNAVPVVSKKLAAALGPKFRRTVDAVSAKLTLRAMGTMNKAVAIDKQSPKAVADAFLKANGLK